jgi:hypothetical protein
MLAPSAAHAQHGKPKATIARTAKRRRQKSHRVTNFLNSATGSNIVHQDSPDQYHVAQTLETPRLSRNMGLDPTNHRVFLVVAKFGELPARGRGRPPVLPGTFSLLVVERGPAAK